MSKPSQVETIQKPDLSELFQCPGELQPIDRAIHLARLERGHPKCRQCPHREDVGELSSRRDRGIRTILSESEPVLPDRFAIKGIESEHADTVRFQRWAARFGLSLRHDDPERFASGSFPRVLLADATPKTVPAFVAAVATGLRWAGCDLIDLGRGASGLLHFAKERLDADAALLLAQPGVWDHECGISVETPEECSLPADMTGDFAEEPFKALDRPTRRQGQLERVSMTDAYLKSFADRYHALRPLKITLYTSCTPVADVLRRLTEPFDVRIEALPFSVAAREKEPVDLWGAHFSVYIDGTGRVVELLDEQRVPIADLDDFSSDAVELVTAVQLLLSRSETSLSELTLPGTCRDKKTRL